MRHDAQVIILFHCLFHLYIISYIYAFVILQCAFKLLILELFASRLDLLSAYYLNDFFH